MFSDKWFFDPRLCWAVLLSYLVLALVPTDAAAFLAQSRLSTGQPMEQREADIERSRQEYVQAQIDEAQGTVRFVPGQQLVLPTVRKPLLSLPMQTVRTSP